MSIPSAQLIQTKLSSFPANIAMNIIFASMAFPACSCAVMDSIGTKLKAIVTTHILPAVTCENKSSI